MVCWMLRNPYVNDEVSTWVFRIQSWDFVVYLQKSCYILDSMIGIILKSHSNPNSVSYIVQTFFEINKILKLFIVHRIFRFQLSLSLILGSPNINPSNAQIVNFSVQYSIVLRKQPHLNDCILNCRYTQYRIKFNDFYWAYPLATSITMNNNNYYSEYCPHVIYLINI